MGFQRMLSKRLKLQLLSEHLGSEQMTVEAEFNERVENLVKRIMHKINSDGTAKKEYPGREKLLKSALTAWVINRKLCD